MKKRMVKGKSSKKMVEDDLKRRRERAIENSSIDIGALVEEDREVYLAMKMAEKMCYVAPSYIGGNGLYVMEDCKSGDIMAEYTGNRIDNDIILEDEKKDEGKYAHEEYMLQSWSGQLVIDASGEKASQAKYVNHMCDPNCEFFTHGLKCTDGSMLEVIFMRAIKNISMFEELGVKYNWSVGKSDICIACRCDCKNCVGVIGKVDKSNIIVKKEARRT